MENVFNKITNKAGRREVTPADCDSRGYDYLPKTQSEGCYACQAFRSRVPRTLLTTIMVSALSLTALGNIRANASATAAEGKQTLLLIFCRSGDHVLVHRNDSCHHSVYLETQLG